MLLPSNYVSYQLEDTVKTRVQDFLSMYGFNFFHYIRCSSKGQVCMLATYNLVLKKFVEYCENKDFLYIYFPDAMHSLLSYTLLWRDLPDQTPIKIAETRGFFDGANFVYRYADYYEMFVLAVPQPLGCPASFYMSKHMAIERFFATFRTVNKDILSAVRIDPIILTEENLGKTHSELLLQKNPIVELSDRNRNNNYVTSQELECIRLMQLGFSRQEISNLMEISSRSVETYQSRVKNRLGLYSNKSLLMLPLAASFKEMD